MEDILAETGYRYNVARDKLSSGYVDYHPTPSCPKTRDGDGGVIT